MLYLHAAIAFSLLEVYRLRFQAHVVLAPLLSTCAAQTFAAPVQMLHSSVLLTLLKLMMLLMHVSNYMDRIKSTNHQGLMPAS